MRRTRLFILFGIALLVSTLYYISDAQERERPLRFTLGEAEYVRCGLDRLTAGEEQELLTLLTAGSMPAYTRRAAREYMQKEGWREIRVVGVVRTDDPFDEFWVVVWDQYELFTLDPWSMPHLPDPGIYWGKNSLSSWTILYPDGSEISFAARDLD